MATKGSLCLRSDPVFIGGVGGSGTSVFAKMLRSLGLDLGRPGKTEWKPFQRFLHGRAGRFVAWERQNGSDDDVIPDRADLGRLPWSDGFTGSGPWGIKVPAATFIPGFLGGGCIVKKKMHLIRDGRDMALSTNQDLRRDLGPVFLPSASEAGAEYAARLWSVANRWAIERGREVLGDRFAALRYEDLVDHPHEVMAEVIEFIELRPTPAQIKAALKRLRPTAGRGRYRELSSTERAAITAAAESGLRVFGYL